MLGQFNIKHTIAYLKSYLAWFSDACRLIHEACFTQMKSITAVGYNTLGHKYVVPAMILYIYIYIYIHSICVSIWLFVSTPFVKYCILINPLLLFAVIFHKSMNHLFNGYLYASGFFVYQNRIFSFYEFVAYSPWIVGKNGRRGEYCAIWRHGFDTGYFNDLIRQATRLTLGPVRWSQRNTILLKSMPIKKADIIIAMRY